MTTKNRNAIEPTIHDYLGILLRGKWIILSTFTVTFAVAVLYIQIKDPTYTATSTILIDKRFATSSLFLDAFRRWNEDENLTQNELEILKSRSLAEEVGERLIAQRTLGTGSGKPIPVTISVTDSGTGFATMSSRQVGGKLLGMVDFEVVPETDIIKINARSTSAEEAALIANAYAKAYYDRNVYTSRAKSRSFREFLEAQVKDKQLVLTETEDSLKKYMQLHGIVSLDDESQKLIDQLSRLESQRDEIDINIQALEKTLTSYQEQIPQQERNLAQVIGEANDPYIRQLQEQLARLEVQRDVTIAQNPTIVGTELYSSKLKEIDDQIGTLREKLKKRTEEYLTTLAPGTGSGTETASYLRQIKQRIAESQIDMQAQQARRAALNNAIQSYERQFALIPSKSIEYARLQRAKQSSEQLYLAVQEKYNEATITEQSQFGYIDIVDEAAVPAQPASPRVPLILLLGIVLGFSSGLLIVFLRERLDVRIYSPEELKREGFSVLGTVLKLNHDFKRFGENPLFALTKPFSIGAESFRHLRTGLSYAKRDRVIKTILVTSARPGEGKTTTASNLAIAFGQTTKRVLLIDADLRRPALHTHFQMEAKEPGLTDYLNSTHRFDDIVRKTAVDSVHVITSGTRTDIPAELLDSHSMAELLEHVKQHYDLIILDSSPVLAGTDPSILATLTDEVIMVVSAGDTRFSEFNRAIELIVEVRSTPPGVVLNKFDLYRAYGIPYGRSGYGYYPYYTKD